MSGRAFPVVPRLDRARQRMRAAAVDALVVSHLPNIRYLTGFVGTAGTRRGDARRTASWSWTSAIRPWRGASWRQRPIWRDHVTVVVPPKSYDETLADVLRESGARRIGIEARLDVGQPLQPAVGGARRLGADAAAQSRRLSRALSDRADHRERARREGRGRDSRRCGRPAAGSAGRRPRPSRWRGRADRSSRSPPTSTRSSAGRVSSAPRSRRSSPPDRTAPCRTRVPVRGCSGRAMAWCWTLAGSTTDTAWILRGRFSWATRVTDFRRLFAAVAEAQQAAIAAVRPGVKASVGRRRSSRGARPIWARRGVRARHRARARARSARGAADRASPGGAAGPGACSPGWCSRSSRAPTSKASAACGSKTMCW